MRIIILTLVCILSIGNSFGQTAFPVEVTNRHLAPIIINDDETGMSYFLYYQYKELMTSTVSNAYLATTDSEFNKVDEISYKQFPIIHKYLGSFTSKDNFYIIYQAPNDRAIRALEFSKKGLGWVEKYIMPYPKKELIIGTTAHKGNMYLMTISKNKKESGVRVYEIPGGNIEDFDMQIYDTDVDLLSYLKGIYLNELDLAYIDGFTNIIDASVRNKMYFQGNKVHLTMDLDDEKGKLPHETVLLTLDLDKQNAEQKILKPNLDAKTASYIVEDKLFQFVYKEGNAEIQIFNIDSGDKIQTFDMNSKMDSIPIQNSLVSLKPYKYEQKYEINARRFLNRYRTWDPYLIGEVVDGEIVLTIGAVNYEKDLATGGGVVSGTSGSTANDVHIFDWYFYGSKLPPVEGNTDIETHLKRYTGGHISKEGPSYRSLNKKMGVAMKKYAKKSMLRVFTKSDKMYIGFFDQFNKKYTVQDIAEME